MEYLYGVLLMYALGVMHMTADYMINVDEGTEEYDDLEIIYILAWPLLAVLTIYYAILHLANKGKGGDQ